MYQIYHADIMEWLQEDRGQFHGLLLDPPYHLTPIVKRFGKPGSAPAKGGVYARSAAGFMGQQWDGGDLAFKPALWEALGEKLYPGGFGMAFASSRGWHRMAVAIEDAGLIIHPSIFGWAYLSGFPKATRIDTQVDKAAGVEVGKGKAHPAFAPRNAGYRKEEFETNGHQDGARHSAQSPLAQAWQGHRYGLQAMKPALEPIIVFQRPYEGRPVDNIVGTGAGALNIDGGRIGVNPGGRINGKANNIYGDLSYTGGEEWEGNEQGRWPANFTLTHSPTCNGVCAPDCPVRLFDEQVGPQKSGYLSGEYQGFSTRGIYGDGGAVYKESYGDSGPASRMFHRSDWSHEIAEQLAQADPVRYEPKASSAEREAGLATLATQTRHRVNAGGLENEPRFAPTQVKNPHPTVKPISLTKYLATLLLPPADYAPRRLLVPFAGVGSEMIGAILAGWDEVIGVEKTAEYLPIAQARLAWWSQWPGWGQSDVDSILAADNPQEGQLSLFTGVAQ